jgi:hypothetical protein
MSFFQEHHRCSNVQRHQAFRHKVSEALLSGKPAAGDNGSGKGTQKDGSTGLDGQAERGQRAALSFTGSTFSRRMLKTEQKRSAPCKV